MDYDRLIRGIAATFGAMTVVLVVLGLVYNVAVLFVALAFGAATYFMYDQASGRMARRVYARVERQARRNGTAGPGRRGAGRGGFGAGPREEWTSPRDGESARSAAGQGARGPGGRGPRGARARGDPRGGRAGGARTGAPGTDRISAAEAYDRLGLAPDADDDEVTAAYREKVKDVHPDTDGGDEEAFKRVNEAYERLTD